MAQFKFTVLKTTFNQEIAKAYGALNIGLCPIHQEGQVFYSNGTQPDGLCDEAWHCFEKYVFAMCHGANGFWEDWIEKRNLSINSCNDGIRPVIFKIEKIED